MIRRIISCIVSTGSGLAICGPTAVFKSARGRKWLLAALLPTSLFLGGCRQTSQRIASLPTAPALSPAPAGTPIPQNPVSIQPAQYPPVPAILPKPSVLGAAYPAVIPLPARMAQPDIRVRITGELPSPPRIRSWLYRGRVEILHLADGKYVAVNVLPMEDYLAGVLSRELYSNWLPAAYRAQAIAARTYALYQIKTFGLTHPWDVTGTQSSQVYGGKDAETRVAWQAVDATRGIVMYGRAHGITGLFCAYFSACNGGASQSADAAWGDHRVSTLQSRVFGSLDANCPDFRWPVKFYSLWQITGAIHHWGLINNLDYLTDLGPITTVRISKTNPTTGRPMVITVTDAAGHVGKLRAEEFRLALLFDPDPDVRAPLSSFFHMRQVGTTVELTHGRGDGHGIGLSQWGAEALAGCGYSARYILNLYYSGNVLHKLW